MDEQRLLRVLRDGRPFPTAYVARPLVLREQPVAARWPMRRLALLLALTALLLAASLVGALLAGLFRPSPLAAVIRQDATCTGHLWQCPDTVSVIYADGHEETIFPPVGSGPVDITPGYVWAPDGRRLVVLASSLASGMPDGYQLYVMDADGSDVRVLARDEQLGSCDYLRWSPDGRTLACINTEYDADGTLVTNRLLAIDAVSGASTELASFPDGHWNSQYRWSPNGEWLVYQVGLASADAAPSDGLWVVRRDGSESRQLLTRAEMPFTFGSTSAFLDNFRLNAPTYVWSPASDAIAFGDHDRRGSSISVVRLNGGRSEIVPPLPLRDRGSGVPGLPSAIKVLAWSRPGEITYGAGGSDWLFMATTKLDGTGGDVLLDWESQLDMPWDRDSGVHWERLWLSADGRTLQWWNEMPSSSDDATGWCLKAAVRGDRRPRTEFCVDAEFLAKAVGEG